MDYNDLKDFKSQKVLLSLRNEIDELKASIYNRCKYGFETCIQGPDGDLLLKYSNKKNIRDFRPWNLRVAYCHIYHWFQVDYFVDIGPKESPHPKVAFMVRDAILDFDPTLPVQVMIQTNKEFANYTSFVVWPNREKITDIKYNLYGGKIDNKKLKGLDKI